MKVTVVGCSPAWPNPGGAQSGYLVEDSGRLLLDCGPGVLPRLREQEAWPRLDAIVISHFHLDHWGDLVPWVWGALFGPGRDGNARKPELWLPPGGTGRLDDFGTHFGRSDMFRLAFDVHEYPSGEPFRAGGFEVTAHRLVHYDLQTYGFRVANGRVALAYSGDSGPCDELTELARGADLFVCEATLANGTTEGGLRGHLAADEAVEAFRAAGAKRLLLTHRPEELPLEPGIEQAYDGLELEL